MHETDATEVVEGYLEAIRHRDFDKARRFLADKGFRSISPIARFDNADAFMANTERAGAILGRMETRMRFSEGDEVCHVLDVTVSLGEYKIVPVVTLARVRDGRITRIESIFDASDYHQMFGEPDIER
jgi:ketosteroid isomerase-like protein